MQKIFSESLPGSNYCDILLIEFEYYTNIHEMTALVNMEEKEGEDSIKKQMGLPQRF